MTEAQETCACATRSAKWRRPDDEFIYELGRCVNPNSLAAEAYGSRHTCFVTNGTSTANKIVTQAVGGRPATIVLLDRKLPTSRITTA